MIERDAELVARSAGLSATCASSGGAPLLEGLPVPRERKAPVHFKDGTLAAGPHDGVRVLDAAARPTGTSPTALVAERPYYFGALTSGAGAVLGRAASIRSKRCAISMKLTSRPAASWSITRKDRLISPRSHEPT